VQNDSTARAASLACPYCGRPLKGKSDRWREAFECDSCGKFADFGAAARRDFETFPRLLDEAPARQVRRIENEDAGEGSR
jgi:hypothetical protein